MSWSNVNFYNWYMGQVDRLSNLHQMMSNVFRKGRGCIEVYSERTIFNIQTSFAEIISFQQLYIPRLPSDDKAM